MTLPAKPVAILAGKSSWDNAVASLKETIGRIEAALAQAGVKATGRPVAVFTRTDDDGFQYEAMVPVDAAPPPGPPGCRRTCASARPPAARPCASSTRAPTTGSTRPTRP